MFAILQMYEFSSKSQRNLVIAYPRRSCLRYCKCTSFQANHNPFSIDNPLQCCLRYCKCTSFQANHNKSEPLPLFPGVVRDTANVRVFKQITTKSTFSTCIIGCLRYCKCTSFQANHNRSNTTDTAVSVVCDTANVRVFKQITTLRGVPFFFNKLFAILQMYEFSSKSQRELARPTSRHSCLRYCKSTIFQANHNAVPYRRLHNLLFAILQMYEFSSKQRLKVWW